MSRPLTWTKVVLAVCAVVATLASPGRIWAQIGGGANGVVVDADGVLRTQAFPDPGGQLHRQRAMAARTALGPKLAGASTLRKISLNRLEAAIRSRVERQMPPTDEMKYLAGLTRVRFVFFYPDTNDIVIAGPAEGWAADLSGRVCGIESGRPVVELQDLIVALRAFAPDSKKSPVILCSIDPTPEGLASMQNFLRAVGARATPADTMKIVEGLRTSLGVQNIRVGGIAANTHFAQVLIEADYRMKLIGIGVEKPPVRLASYVDRANPSDVSRNALQRWFFVPEYECIRVTADDLGMELVGDGVKLVGEDQVVARDGSRKVSGRGNRASQMFVNGFTQKYRDLAAKVPVYAQLRNVIDLAVAAAFIRDRGYFAKAGWQAELFRDEQRLPVETYNTPLHVETVVTAVWKGNHLMTPVGGGVHIEPHLALKSPNLLHDDEGSVSTAREAISLDKLAPDAWWWD